MLVLSVAWAAPCGLADAMDGVVPWTVSPADVPPPPGADDTCWGPQGQNQLKTDHFSIEWDDGVTDDEAAAVGVILEQAWDRQIEQQGWPAVTLSDEYLVLARLEPGEGRSYALTADCGVQQVPFTVVYLEDPELEATLHHEFNHLSQFSQPGLAWGVWWWEATATWMQAVMVPDQSELVDTVVRVGFLDQPHIAMHESRRDTWERDAHLYGMAVWAWHLEDVQPGLVLETWQSGEGDMPSSLAALGHDFDAVFEDYVRALALNQLGRPVKWGLLGSGRVDDLYASGEVAVDSLGIGVVRFHTEAPAPEGSHLNVNVTVSEGDWLLWLVGAGDNPTVVELTSGQDAILPFTADYQDVLLIAAPTTGLDQEFAVSWEAWSSGEPSSGGYTAAFPTEEGGCSTGPAPPLLWVLGLVVIRRRGVSEPPTNSASEL